jgi:hypothetical protein
LKSGTLFFVLIAVVLVVLFVLSLASSSDAVGLPLPIDVRAVSLESVRGRLTQRFTAAQITLISGDGAQCRLEPGRFVVAVGAACVYGLQAAEQRTRRLPLVLQGAGGAVAIRLEQENALSVEETLAAQQAAFNLDVFRHPEMQVARLTIFDCRDVTAPEEAPACVLQWEP